MSLRARLLALALALIHAPLQAGGSRRVATPTTAQVIPSVPTISAQTIPGLPSAAIPSAGLPGLSIQADAHVPHADVQDRRPAAATTASARPSNVSPSAAAPNDAASPGATTVEAKKIARSIAEFRKAFEIEGPNSLAEVDLDPLPGHAYYPSQEDHRDETMIYSVLVDRFARSNNGKADGDPTSGKTRHGGDIRGIIEKLDYLQRLGASTLLLSPIMVTTPEPENYHGYGPIHFMAIDPRLGRLADFKELVGAAHKRGIRVMMDLVINHSGPVFDYKEDSRWRGMDQPAKDIVWRDNGLRPVELHNPERYTRHGLIEKWTDHEQAVHGDFPPDYRHFSSDGKATQDDLIKIASWWIKETDIDGFRLDALRHIDAGFAKRFTTEIKAYAASLGKNNFMLLGENSTGIDEEIKDSLATGVASAYNYPEFRRFLLALHGKAPTYQLEESLHRLLEVLGPMASQLVRFIDHQDVYRFLREGEPLGVLRVGLAFLMLSLGIPLVYYGTEQAFRQKSQNFNPEHAADHPEPENRQDMFPEGRFKTASSAGDKFDTNSESYRWLTRLSKLRKFSPALRRGAQYVRWSDPWGPGIFAFSRILDNEEVLVVLNTAPEARKADMWVDADITPAGTSMIDALDPAIGAASYAFEGGSKISVEVPANSVRVFVRGQKGQ